MKSPHARYTNQHPWGWAFHLINNIIIIRMKSIIHFLGTVSLLGSLSGCEQQYEAPVPIDHWDVFDSPNAVPLSSTSRAGSEGVYAVTQGADVFGDQVALKWSYLAEGTDTTYYLSAFSGREATYFVMEGRRIDNNFYFEGYWRKKINTETGIARFTVEANKGGAWLLSGARSDLSNTLTLKGVYGNNQDIPLNKVVFKYKRPLNFRPLHILAHRSGGRTSDLLPVSENSVGIVKMASRFGATGIEIDIRLTKDGVPVLYHDNTLNLRLIQKNGLVGPIEEYTYEQLYQYVKLVDGQHIPTLTEALDAVLNNTDLRFVWLDTKYVGSLQIMRAIQKEYLEKAAAAGRKLEIVIGLPEEDKVNMFLALPDHASAPALCELEPETARKINAKVWAPRWTLGTQNEEVLAIQAEGRQAFV